MGAFRALPVDVVPLVACVTAGALRIVDPACSCSYVGIRRYMRTLSGQLTSTTLFPMQQNCQISEMCRLRIPGLQRFSYRLLQR